MKVVCIKFEFFTNLLGLFDLCNFCALKSETRHESLLVEEKGEDTLLRGGRRERARHTRVGNHDRRSGPNLPALGILKITEILIAHKKQRIAE